MSHLPTLDQTIQAVASSVLTDLALAINEHPDVSEVQQLVVEKAAAALGAASASVMMPADESGRLRVVAATGKSNETRTRPESPVAEWVMRHNEPLLLIGREGPLAHLLRRDDIRDAVCVPLRYGGSVIGALSASNSQGRGEFTQSDVDLLTIIGHVAAVALQNTTLYEEAKGHRQQLQSVLRQLWSTQEDERRRLAEDLHDGPAQALFHIVFRLQTARGIAEKDPTAALACMEQAEDVARETLAQVRAIMAGLRPMSLDDLGLVPALRTECRAIDRRGATTVDVRVTGEPRRFGVDLETALYRMAREALSNIERHAESTRAVLEIAFDEFGVTVSIRDWGKGFTKDAAKAARAEGRVGLTALQERAQALDIALSVASDIGRGTRVTMRCPWRMEL